MRVRGKTLWGTLAVALTLAAALAANIGCGKSQGSDQAASTADKAQALGLPHNAWTGKTAAAFALPGVDGKLVDIAADLGKRPVVLFFYRGVW